MALRNSRTARFLRGLVEFLPLMAFVYAGRFDAELAARFYWGAGSLVIVVPVLFLLRRRPNPLLVAVNTWLCFMAFSFLVHIPALVRVLETLRESSFFLAILVIGAGYTFVSDRGLLTADHGDRKQVRGYSLVLIGLALGGLACSAAFRGNEFYAAVLPAMLLFLVQSLLNARLRLHTG